MPPKTVVLDPHLANAIAIISTAVVGNLMGVLLNKGLIDREDIAEVVAFTRAGGGDDAGTAAMSKLCADALENWVRTIVQDN